jgi:hypothetical protein
MRFPQFLPAFLAPLALGAPALANDGPHVRPELWHMTPTFQDDFQGPDLDRAKWGTRYPGADQDFGERGSFSFVNDPAAVDKRAIQLRLRNGVPSPAHLGTGNDGLDSTGKPTRPPRFEQRYGWFEVRVKTATKLPGFVSAFWLWPKNGLQEGGGLGGNANRPNPLEPDEIDIFEQRSNNPQGNTHTLHYGPNPNGPYDGPGHWMDQFRDYHLDQDFGRDYHVLAADWTPQYVAFYMDGKQVGRSNRAPKIPMLVLLGLYGNPVVAPPAPPPVYDVPFTIDYIRVYQRKAFTP